MTDVQRPLQAQWLVTAEYDGETVISGPYTEAEAERVRDYCEREDAPMGTVAVSLDTLAPPLEIDEPRVENLPVCVCRPASDGIHISGCRAHVEPTVEQERDAFRAMLLRFHQAYNEISDERVGAVARDTFQLLGRTNEVRT